MERKFASQPKANLVQANLVQPSGVDATEASFLTGVDATEAPYLLGAAAAEIRMPGGSTEQRPRHARRRSKTGTVASGWEGTGARSASERGGSSGQDDEGHGSTNSRPGPYDQECLAGNHKGKKAQKRIEATPFENEGTRDEPPSVRRQQQGPGQTRHEVRRRRQPWRQPGPRSEVARDPHEARRVRSTRGQPVRRVRGAEGTATDAQEGATRPNRQQKGHVRP